LSNAGLPEINPLLELDGTLVDDYQKMLNDWETQMETMQVRRTGIDFSRNSVSAENVLGNF
jgi:hypothetical protein